MSYLLPSLAVMDNKSLWAYVTALSILVITLVVNVSIQIETEVIEPVSYHPFSMPPFIAAYIYMAIPTLKKVLELKYRAILNDQNLQENLIFNVEELRQLLKRHWIMAVTGSPEFMMASTPLSSASGVICTISMVVYSIFVMACMVLRFKAFANQSSNHFSVFKVEKLSSEILSICIAFQKVTVVLCKIIELIPIMITIFVTYCSYYFESMKALLFTPLTASSNDEDLSNYVLSLEDNVQIPRVETFDMIQIQSLMPVELVNSWSLPIISLTCIAIAIPNIDKDAGENLLKSVGEGLYFSRIVDGILNNKTSEHVNIRRASVILWCEVRDKHKYLDTTLKRSAYEGKNPTEIIILFVNSLEEITNEFSRGINEEPIEKENLPIKVIAANSMYQIAQTILRRYESNNLEIIEHELFVRLFNMIADISAACLTNLPRVIIKACHESAIEKRELDVMAAIRLIEYTS
ncbi:uncharacterized protein LOC143547095 [Bidens hawaiensis]|uniref:uncharacterized protein LOC143547095 n=1 Tax=Bidens hawaiensis TaxID=980011 RepID=UPI00404A8C52